LDTSDSADHQILCKGDNAMSADAFPLEHESTDKRLCRWFPAMGPLILAAVGSCLAAGVETGGICAEPSDAPNVVVIFIDDMGYADIGPFGAEGYATPNLDRMAREGRIFTDFYAAQAVCSASRAALMTGCYNVRVGILGALAHQANHGISDREMTLAEVVKQKGYATACYGKWHLGHHPKFLPANHGFDEYLGLPYSNDMWPFHPTAGKNFPDLPLIEDTRIIDADVTGDDQTQLTTRYTQRAVQFIERNKDRPFFVYLPHSMVHVPLYVSDKFRGKSSRGLFGDVVMEIDWSVGQILDTLRKHQLDRRTLVIFTADNGPWLSYGDHAGSAGPHREGKGTMFDGGCREPTVMWWPGKIPPGTVCKEPAMTIDILPTLAHLVGASLPDHKIDGQNIWPLMAGEPDAKSPQEAYYFYWGQQLQAVRMGRWKLHFPHTYRTLGGKPGGTGGRPVAYEEGTIELALFDLEVDSGETTNVVEQHPDVVAKMQALAERMRADLGDSATKSKGTGVREPGRLQAGDLRFNWVPGRPLDTQ
jgi:arylsulfatase A-like enzyme